MAWITLGIAWLACWLGGAALARFLGTRFSAALLRFGKYKFDDPSAFVYHRLHEALWLVTLAFVWVGLHRLLGRWLHRRSPHSKWHWAPQSLVGFVLLNVWVAFAMETALFWIVLGFQSGSENYMQFRIKRIIATENRAPYRVLLVGSSQTDSEFEEDDINRAIGSTAWTTEVHYPTATAHDLLITERLIRCVHAHFVVCYLSEYYFYLWIHGEAPKRFLSILDLPELWRLGSLQQLSRDEIGYGVTGNLLPIFRCRDILLMRFFGTSTRGLDQLIYDSGLTPDLDARAREFGKAFTLSESSRIEKQALEIFIDRCQAQGSRVILLGGGMNPILTRYIDPAVRRDYVSFLAELPSRHPNVIVVPPEELPPQPPEVYYDLSHANPAGTRLFTDFFTAYLAKLVGAKLPPGKD